MAAPGSVAELTLGQGAFAAPPPPTLSIGSGFEWRRLTLEVDAVATFGSDTAIETRLDSTTYGSDSAPGIRRREVTTERTRTTTSWRAGAEWFFYPTLSLLAGARVDPGALVGPVDGAGTRFGQTRTQSVAGSLGLGSYGKGAELLAGAELSYTFGETVALTPGNPAHRFEATGQRGTCVLLVVSGSVGLSSLRRVVENVHDVGKQHLLRPR
jgi:hypothetical protein